MFLRNGNKQQNLTFQGCDSYFQCYQTQISLRRTAAAVADYSKPRVGK